MPDFQKLEKSMAELSELIEKNSDASNTLANGAVVLSRTEIIGAGMLAIIVTMLVGYFVSRSIITPLKEVTGFAALIAAGDLSATMQVNMQDRTEIGQLKHGLRDMTDSLQKIVAQVRTVTDTMATTSGEIAAGNLDLSSRTEMQASALEKTASSMEELDCDC